MTNSIRNSSWLCINLRIFKLIVVTVICLFLFGCSFPFHSLGGDSGSITDISELISFQNIQRQSFMGGSVIYNPTNPLSGQLSNGVSLAIRLGYVSRDNTSNNDIFVDVEKSSQYGKIYIINVDNNGIAFSLKLFDNTGKLVIDTSYSLGLNEVVDINSDGLPDLEYKRPLRKRTGFEKAIYLNFLSSQETLNTSMFSVIPEQYSRGVYPSGIMGVNPNGRFIVSKYEVNSPNRAVVLGVSYGDYVLDTKLGEYQKIISTNASRNARTISDSELITIKTTSNDSYYFKDVEFYDDESLNLFNVMPSSVRNSNEILEIDNIITKLNAILRNRNLLKLIAEDKELDTDIPEILEILNQLTICSEDEVVEFNRHFLGAIYPEFCPDIQTISDDITTIFPLLSIFIADSQTEQLVDEANFSRFVGAQTTSNYTEYISQKAEIVKIHKSFYPIGKYSYTFPGWDKLFVKKSNGGSESSDPNTVSATIPPENYQRFSEIKKTLAAYPKTNLPTSVTNGASLEVGIMGHFKITWGNVEGGIHAGVFISADTNLDISKTLVQYPVTDIPKVMPLESKTSLVNVDLKLFDAPPVTIGVVTFKFSLTGGIDIPCSVKVEGNMITSLYAGYTGFYSVGFNAGANYGVKTKTYKAWGLKITIPVGWNFDPYAKGSVINQTAFFVGNVSEINIPVMPKLQSAKIEMCVSPYVYIEPGVTIASCLYGGMQIGPCFDLGIGMKLNVNDTNYLPTGLDIYGIYGYGLGLNATYGIGITIPIINKKIEHRDKVSIPNPLREPRTTKTIKSFTF